MQCVTGGRRDNVECLGTQSPALGEQEQGFKSIHCSQACKPVNYINNHTEDLYKWITIYFVILFI